MEPHEMGYTKHRYTGETALVRASKPGAGVVIGFSWRQTVLALLPSQHRAGTAKKSCGVLALTLFPAKQTADKEDNNTGEAGTDIKTAVFLVHRCKR